MPFYPWVPVIGIVTRAFLAVYLFRFSPLAWFYAVGWIAVGVGVFFAYARGRVAGEDEPQITYEDKRGVRSGYAILAPVANPGHVDAVVRVAAALGAVRDAEVVALNVVRIPQTLPIAEGRGYTSQAAPVVEAVQTLGEQLSSVQLYTVVGIGRKISTVITTTAAREGADLIVAGWHGAVREGKVRGSVVQEVLRTAHRDVVVVKDQGLPDEIDEILVGVSPGPRARHIIDVGADLALGFDATLRVLTVTPPDEGNAAPDRFHTEVGEHLADRVPSHLVRFEHSASADVTGTFAERAPSHLVRFEHSASADVTGTFAERAQSSSLVVIGASRDWFSWRTLGGSFADRLANHIDRSIVLVRPHERRPLSWWRQAVGVLRGR